MGGIKLWHGLLFAAAVAALAWLTYSAFSGDQKIEFAKRDVMVDVTTGELFSFDISGRKAVVVPEKNPKTGKATLLGAERAPDGRWFIRERHRSMLANVEGEHTAIVDPATGEVRVPDETVRRGRP